MPTRSIGRKSASWRDARLPPVVDPPQPTFSADDLIAALSAPAVAVEGLTTSELAQAMGREQHWVALRLKRLIAGGTVEYAGKAPKLNMIGELRPQPCYRLKRKAA